MLVEITPYSEHLDQELEAAREIRNSVREFMTNNRDSITKSEQIAWYNTLDHSRFRLFLFEAGRVPIGYGIINTAYTPYPMLTGAILKSYQGLGFGRELFSGLLNITNQQYEQRAALDVLRTNERAIKFYQSLGFIEEASSDDTVFMMYSGQKL